jgi:hypothetical protein
MVQTHRTMVGVTIISDGTSNNSSSASRALGIGLAIGIPSFLMSLIGLVVKVRHYGKRAHGKEVQALTGSTGPKIISCNSGPRGSGYGNAF